MSEDQQPTDPAAVHERTKAAMILAKSIGGQFGELEFGEVPTVGHERMATQGVDPRAIAAKESQLSPQPQQPPAGVGVTPQPTPQTNPHMIPMPQPDGGEITYQPQTALPQQQVTQPQPLPVQQAAAMTTPPAPVNIAEYEALKALHTLTVEALIQNTAVLKTAVRKLKQLTKS